MKKIKGFVKLIRFELPLSAGICVVMGQLLALGEFASTHILILGFVSVFLVSASILVLNDYFDIETDKINAPDRPIASNIISPSEAFYFSVILLVVGILLSYLINLIALITSIILAIIGFLYNRYFKKRGLLGNLMVSLSVGMTFVYGGISVGLPFHKTVLLFALIAALIDLGEEIAADAMDIKGDLLIESNSIAIKYGKPTALKISAFLFSFVILISIIPFVLNWFSNYYFFAIVVMDLSIGYSTLKLIKSEGEEGRKYIRWIYLGATLGLLIFLLMRFLKI